MDKKKILLLSDDLRMNSGVATMSRELVLGTLKRYNWIQIAGAIQHPDKGKVINMDAASAQMSGVPDAKVTIYPVDGYGDENILFSIIDREKPDAIMHFTDPRFWGWLYALERQIRAKIPLVYYNIWDDVPYPMYNRPYYESCDCLMSISKQTYNINKWVLTPKNCFSVKGDFDDNGNDIPFPKAEVSTEESWTQEMSTCYVESSTKEEGKTLVKQKVLDSIQPVISPIVERLIDSALNKIE
jgi:hypothetical protein